MCDRCFLQGSQMAEGAFPGQETGLAAKKIADAYCVRPPMRSFYGLCLNRDLPAVTLLLGYRKADL